MRKVKVLFVDDDVILGKVVTLALNNSGYEAYYQTSLAAIKSVILEINPDIIILDVEIGTKNGIDITPDLKILVPDIPIIFVSSHIQSDEVAKALYAGGIAYIKKPFEIEELLAYISRHTYLSSQTDIHFGNCILDIKESAIILGNQTIIHLTSLECKLLKLLIAYKNEVVTREEIEKELWGKENGNEHSLNNYISKLRKTLSIDPLIELKTIPKTGYKLLI